MGSYRVKDLEVHKLLNTLNILEDRHVHVLFTIRAMDDVQRLVKLQNSLPDMIYFMVLVC